MHLSFEQALFLRLISKPKFTFLLSLSRPLFLLVLWMLSDHCAKKLLPWLDGMLDADETYFKEHGESRPFKGEEGQFVVVAVVFVAIAVVVAAAVAAAVVCCEEALLSFSFSLCIVLFRSQRPTREHACLALPSACHMRAIAGVPLFSSHMIDLSECEMDENIETSAKYLERCSKVNILLEMELGITGGEEDGVDNTDIDNSRLYSQPEDIWVSPRPLVCRATERERVCVCV